jgi:hypothetical protein
VSGGAQKRFQDSWRFIFLEEGGWDNGGEAEDCPGNGHSIDARGKAAQSWKGIGLPVSDCGYCRASVRPAGSCPLAISGGPLQPLQAVVLLLTGMGVAE